MENSISELGDMMSSLQSQISYLAGNGRSNWRLSRGTSPLRLSQRPRTEEEELRQEAEDSEISAAEQRQTDALQPGAGSSPGGSSRTTPDISPSRRWVAPAPSVLLRNFSKQSLRIETKLSRTQTHSSRGGSQRATSRGSIGSAVFSALDEQLSLFGDLHEGGHAGHFHSGSHSVMPCGVLLPWSKPLLFWDLVCTSLLLVMCFYVPYRLAFLSQRVLSWPADAWLLVIDIVYLLDIGVTLSTAYYDYLGNLETRRMPIVWRYLRGWFVLDLVACFPSDWLYLLSCNLGRQPPKGDLLLALRGLRLLRSLRLISHQRVFTYLSHLFARLRVRTSYITILKRTITIFIFAHCNACLQFLMAVLAGLPPDCWVVRAGLHTQPEGSQYLASIFHATSQMLAVGHGIALPARDSEYATFIISLVLGANLYAVFVGTLISVIEDANGSHREYCKRVDMLQTWMAQRQVRGLARAAVHAR